MNLPENPATAKFLLELAADMVKWFGITPTVEFNSTTRYFQPRTTSWRFERGNRLVIIVYQHDHNPQRIRFAHYLKEPSGTLIQQTIKDDGGWRHRDENMLDNGSNYRLLWIDGRGVSSSLKTHVHDFLAQASAWP